MLPKGSWPNVFQEAAKAMEEYLFSRNVLPPNSEFHALYLHALNQYYSNRESTHAESGTLYLLTTLLAKTAIKKVAPEIVEGALDAFYSVTRENWQVDPHSLTTLHALHEQGFQVGMVSNAANEKDVLTLLDNFQLTDSLEFVITSFGCGYRKPHPAIFTKVSEYWNIPLNQVIMVGDRTDTDILGARSIGMRTAWLNRYKQRNKTPGAIPDLEIRSLPELISCLN